MSSVFKYSLKYIDKNIKMVTKLVLSLVKRILFFDPFQWFRVRNANDKKVKSLFFSGQDLFFGKIIYFLKVIYEVGTANKNSYFFNNGYASVAHNENNWCSGYNIFIFLF